jgi:hypothetical protein
MKVASIQAVAALQEDRRFILANGQRVLELASRIKGKVSQVNVPEIAPPEVPRLLIQRPDLVASLSFSRVELTIRPPQHVAGNLDSAMEFAERTACPILDELVLPDRGYEWSGVVVELLFPVPGENVSAATQTVPLFDRLVRIERRGRELAAFQLQFGFAEGDYFINATVEGYETRLVEAGPGAPASVAMSIDLSKQPVAESGIGLIVDINNRAGQTHRSAASDVADLMRRHRERLPSLLGDLTLEEFAK